MYYSKEKLDTLLESLINKYDLPGASVGVYQDGVSIHSSYGYLEDNYKVPYSLNSIFRVGCVVKVFHAAQIMALKDQGKIDIGEPITNYLPQLKSFKTVTTRHLLSHSSGLPGNLADVTEKNVLERLNILDEQEVLLFEPGTNCSYSSLGYLIVAKLIEELSGETWEENLNTRIFEPLDIDCTQLESNRDTKVFAPEGKIHYEGEWLKPHLKHNRMLPSEGGTLALSTKDLLAFCRMHIDKGLSQKGVRILSKESVKEMSSFYASLPGKWPLGGQSLSIGWLRYQDGSLGFSGNGLGNHCFLKINPDNGSCITMATNYHNSSLLFSELYETIFSDSKNNDYQSNVNIKENTNKNLTVESLSGSYYCGQRKVILSNIGGKLGVKSSVYHQLLQTFGYDENETNRVFQEYRLEGMQLIVNVCGFLFEYSLIDMNGDGDISYLWDGMCLFKKR